MPLRRFSNWQKFSQTRANSQHKEDVEEKCTNTTRYHKRKVTIKQITETKKKNKKKRKQRGATQKKGRKWKVRAHGMEKLKSFYIVCALSFAYALCIGSVIRNHNTTKTVMAGVEMAKFRDYKKYSFLLIFFYFLFPFFFCCL